jgi:hypothetical protein
MDNLLKDHRYPIVPVPSQFQPDMTGMFLDMPQLDDLRKDSDIGVEGVRRLVGANLDHHVDVVGLRRIGASAAVAEVQCETSVAEVVGAIAAAVIGKAERFIQTALREWAYGTHWTDSHQRDLALAPWTDYYNFARPHGSLHYQPPISRSETGTTS